MKPRLVVVVGPTASGKTSLGCALAERLGAEIVSADSQQCYRGLDEGTAKPTAEERARVPHHLLDVREPEEQLDAAAFVRLADAAIAELAARGKRALVVGGTGLWIRALLHGLVDAPGASQDFRARFRGEVEARGLASLHAELAHKDPDAAARILPGDRVRIERALEVHALSGERLSDLQRRHAFQAARYQARLLFLDPPREVLWQRIEARTRALFETGALVRETRWLLERASRVPSAAKALKIIGYGECADALRDETPRALAAARERVLARTRQYAKRQRTWFRRDAGAPLPWPPDAQGLCDLAEQWYGARR